MDPTELTHPPDLRSSTGVGPVRAARPVYVDSLPPCNHACPAGENIQAWLAHLNDDDPQAAWQTLVRDNPMPSVHGRVCYHPCEDACNRGAVDQAVSIHAVERYLGDLALKHGWEVPLENPGTGQRVLIVGGGPSGLSAAWHLAMAGHQVEIRDAGPKPGGMMRYGIPAYRLPRDILDAEINRILAAGVKLTLNHKVEDILGEKADGGFDAVFVAIGAHLARKADIPARDAGRILDAVSYLEAVETNHAPRLGRRVAVYGGGNTAMDAARTARRLGAAEATIIYRRDRSHMPAHEFEAAEAEAEGVRIHWLRSIRAMDGRDLAVEVMEIDEAGHPQPTGRFERLEADSVILALGQDVDLSVLESISGVEIVDEVVQVGANMMTGVAGVFAGGDMVPGERTVTVATGHGKKAARHIDAWLRGTTYRKPNREPTVGPEQLHLHYLTAAARRNQPHAVPHERSADFREVTAGLAADAARFEAARCYACGNCFRCDGCLGACPESAIHHATDGQPYVIDYDRCTGCQACVLQCPSHAMEMVVEEPPGGVEVVA